MSTDREEYDRLCKILSKIDPDMLEPGMMRTLTLRRDALKEKLQGRQTQLSNRWQGTRR